VGPRYFLVSVPFFLLLLSRGLGDLARCGRAGKAIQAIAVVAFCAASAVPVSRLIRDGRGHYAEAVAYMTAATPGDDVTVGADHDFRNEVVLSYHAARLAGAKRLLLAPRDFGSSPPPLWFLLHDLAERPAAAPAEISRGGFRFLRVASFPFAGLSGWHWFLYRRDTAG
jgi:hypothetical protein